VAYITPITDRSIADIIDQTSKAYFNIADWERVYNNSRLASSLASIALNTPIAFSGFTLPTITTDPRTMVANINMMTGNIENVRLAVEGESIPGTESEIKDDYIAGKGQVTPNYTDVNLWESTIDAIWEHYNGASLPVCPTLTTSLVVSTGNQKIYVDCIETGGFDIDINGTGEFHII
jgi:hypothetical protein